MRSDPPASLGDLVSLVRGNTYKSTLLRQPGPVLLGLASIQREGGFRGDALKTYGGESAEKLLMRPGDLYVSLKDVTQSGDLLGAVARVPKSVALGRLTQDTVKLQFDSERYPANLLYWTLRCPEYRSYCRERAIGTTNLSLSREDFLAFPLPIATRERLELVELLEAIERRIDLLRQTNATLEAIAQALFKSWFIDFDPVRAKAEGRDPEGMAPATAALFPSEFEDSLTGPIPKDWRAAKVSDVFRVTMGQSPPGETYNEDGIGIPFYQGRADFGFRFPAVRVHCTAPTRLAEEGDALVSVRAPVGDVNVALEPCAVGRGVAAISLDESPSYALYAMQALRERFKEYESHGTVFGSINKKQFEALPCILPTSEILQRFDVVASALDERIRINELQIRSLTSVRDTLLPRLISGKLRLSEAEREIEIEIEIEIEQATT